MRRITYALVAILLLASTSLTSASSDLDAALDRWSGEFAPSEANATDTGPLPALEAFDTTAWHNGETLHIGIASPAGYYLYRQQLEVESVTGEPSLTFTGPEGVAKDDPFFGKTQVFPDAVVLTAPLTSALETGDTIALDMRFQGCAEDFGVCYPETSQTLNARYLASPPSRFESAARGVTPLSVDADTREVPSTGDRFLTAMQDASLPALVGVFFLAGLALALTPCVLPMLPILSSIVVGRGATPSQAFGLSSAYVSGVIATYTALGVIMGVLGSGLNIQGYLQSPVVIITFATLFFVLALFMAGIVSLPSRQATSAFQSRISALQDKLQTMGKKGTAGAGALSVLVVSPCVSAPLAATLVFISTTGDALIGGLALMALSTGMSVPLLLAGTFGAKLLPKAGAWMEVVKVGFAFMLAGVAVWLVSRLISPAATLALWGMLALLLAAYLWRMVPSRSYIALAAVPFVWGIALLIGAAVGSQSPFNPLAGLWTPDTVSASATTVASLEDVQAFVQQKQGDSEKPIMVMFKADWCVYCDVMERRLQQPDIAAALEDFHRLDVDVTDNTQRTREVMQACDLFAPPGIMFFDDGERLSDWSLYGEVPEDALLRHLEELQKAI